MKRLLSLPGNAYLFWRIKRIISLKHCTGQYGRYFSTVTAVQRAQTEVFNKAGLHSKRQKNIGKRFSSNTQNSVTLMDFDVWVCPKLLYIIRSIFYYPFLFRYIENFSITEFTVGSAKALQVVTTLLSEQRFSELEGLLTPECKEQVENNLKNWNRTQISCLAIKPEQEISTFPCDISVILGKGNNRKVLVEVRVIHYVWFQFSAEFQNKNPVHSQWVIEDLGNKFASSHVGAVFNCKFITEITNGTVDQWMINAINVKMWPKALVKL